MTDRTDDLLIVNPLPWSRSISGPVSSKVIDPRAEADDPFSARHYQDRGEPGDEFVLPPTTVPGYGYATVSKESLIDSVLGVDTRGTVETDRYRITFDRETGGIAAWYDRELDCEWVDEDADYPLGSPVFERVGDADPENAHGLVYRSPTDVNGAVWHAAPELVKRGMDTDAAELLEWQSDWHAVRRGPDTVTRHRVTHTKTTYIVEQDVSLEGFAEPIELRFTIPRDDSGVTIEATWEASPSSALGSGYLAFPFAMTDPTPRIDVGGQAMEPGADQLPGTNHDFFAVQRWVDFSETDRSMTVGCPLNPLVQLGGFTYGADREEFSLDSPLLLGWVSSTPLRAETVRARYHFSPSAGPFDEAEAHRVGTEAEYPYPIAQTMGEPLVADGALSSRGSLLDLPEPPVLVTSFQPGHSVPSILRPSRMTDATDDESALLVLLNASDEPQEAAIGPGLLEIESVSTADLYGVGTRKPFEKRGDDVPVPLAPREMVALRVRFAEQR